MTMAFKVADRKLLDGRRPGDLVRGTLVVQEADAHLRTLERTGFSALSEAPPPVRTPQLARGDRVADATFVDEEGKPRRLTEWQGRIVAVTFIYTRCPLPNFCPLMDRHFKAVQDRIREDPALAGRARLLSVSFDPRHDTASVLSQHASNLKADPSIWQFVTGAPDEVDAFAAQFGVSILRDAASDQEIVHNLRTAIIDAQGRLVTILNGRDWTPSDLLTELRNAGAEPRLPQEGQLDATGRPH
jgi:protein SCO1/2